MDTTMTEYRILPDSPVEAMFLSYNVSLRGYTFPVDTHIILDKFTINLEKFQWRFNDSMIYELEIKDRYYSNPAFDTELLYKYIWKTLIKERNNDIIRSVVPDGSELSAISEYLFHSQFVEVGISLIDYLMKRLRDESKTKKGEIITDLPSL